MAVTAEQLFQTRGQDIVQLRESFRSPKYRFPIQYYSSIWDQLARNQERIPRNAQYSLTADDVPRVIPHLFEGDRNDGLERTLSTLDPDLDMINIRSVDGRFLQFGQKALILMYKTTMSNGQVPLHFVAYLSREPEGSNLDAQAVEDYRNLSELHAAWNARVGESAKEKFSVTSPLSLRQVTIDDKRYRYFTMTYLPLREIGIEFFIHTNERTDSLDLGKINPFVINNINVDDPSATAIARIQAVAARNADSSIWEAKRHDILLAEALAYLVTDGRWPAREHLISAGDLNGVMTETGGFSHMGWTTVRGGFSESPSRFRFDQTFVDRMKQHGEYTSNPMLKVCEITKLNPFGNMSSGQLRNILSEARHLLK